MTLRRVWRRAAVGTLAVAIALRPPSTDAAPVLREAAVDVAITSPTTCDVTMTVTIDGAAEVEHRIQSFGSPEDVQLISIGQAGQVGAIRAVGRTQALVLRPQGDAYRVSYRVRQTAERATRCPIWLPTVPTDGRSRAVRLRVTLPADAVPGSSMPALQWAGRTGSATLGHLPAFVRAPYTLPGEPKPWDIAGRMDTVTVVVFAAASAIWAWRRRR